MPLKPETLQRVDEIVAHAQAYGQAPSVLAGVVRDGNLAYTAGAGELPAPDPDVQYRIGSITKTFTAALVMRLRDEGRLNLDEPAHRHLPELPTGPVTLRALLGHAGGLRREPPGDWWERAPGLPAERVVAALSADRSIRPYRSHHYSNLAYGLLGLMLTRVTGVPWATQVSRHLLEPLDMHRTTYHPEEPFARGYVVHPWHGTLREEPRHDSGAMAPAGQLWSTVGDLAKWAAFLARPVPEVLAAGTVAEMCAPVVIADPDSWTAGHGLGLEMWRRGERVYIGHTGSMPGYLAVLAVHRPSGTGVVAVVNAYSLRRSGPDGPGDPGGKISRLGLDILDAVLDREPTPVPAWRPGAAPPPDVEALTGRWWWMGIEFEVSWRPAARELWMRPVDDPAAVPWRFTAMGDDRWRCHSGSNRGEMLTVRRGRTGSVAALDVATAVFTRDPWPSL